MLFPCFHKRLSSGGDCAEIYWCGSTFKSELLLEFIIKKSRTQFYRLSNNEPFILLVYPFVTKPFPPKSEIFQKRFGPSNSPLIVSVPSIFLEELFSFEHGTASA
jgi:hypothetical protein